MITVAWTYDLAAKNDYSRYRCDGSNHPRTSSTFPLNLSMRLISSVRVEGLEQGPVGLDLESSFVVVVVAAAVGVPARGRSSITLQYVPVDPKALMFDDLLPQDFDLFVMILEDRCSRSDYRSMYEFGFVFPRVLVRCFQEFDDFPGAE